MNNDIRHKMNQDSVLMEKHIKTTLDNTAYNLSKAKKIGVSRFKSLKGWRWGETAYILSSGPSLEGGIKRFIKDFGEGVVISCAQALSTADKYGVVPDFVTSIDINDHNIRHFGNIPPGVPLVASLAIHPSIVDLWVPNPITYVAPLPKEASLQYKPLRKANKYGHVGPMGSVAHMSAYLAIKLGCTKVILMGQDLCLDTTTKETTDVMYTFKLMFEDIIVDNQSIKWLNASNGLNIVGTERI